MKQIVTRDGSITFHNETFGETYHAMSGASEEALRKHVIPSKVLDKKDDIVLVDICFGLGYNTIVAISKIREQDPNASISVFAFENDGEILKRIKDINFGPYEEVAEKVRKLEEVEENIFLYMDENMSITLYLGDVRDKISILADDLADAVFFDPFSPKKHPELWDKTLFDELFRVMKEGSILTTYSCARMARENMVAAGFVVEDGPVVGRVSPGTLAKKP